MKLTKGKLSKIHAKKKQTMRKFKVKGKRSVKKKTFRKKRPLNLNHKTLKNIPIVEFKSGLIKGGVKDDNDGDIEMQNLSTQSTSKVQEPAAEPVQEPATVQDNLDENKNGEMMQQEPAAEPVTATVQDNILEMDQGEKDDSEQVLEQMEQEREKEKEEKEKEENERKREAETAQPVESYLRDNEKLFDQEYKTEENDKSEDLNEISKLFEGYVTKLVSKAMTNANTNATANVNSGIQNPVDAVRESVETLSSIQK